MTDQLNHRELVSALVDGQLRGHDFARAVELAAGDPDARSAWQAYHVVGDALRSGGMASRTPDAGFLARLEVRLALEPAPGKPAVLPQVPAGQVVALATPHAPAANESGLRWKLVAGFASLAAVAAIGWNVAAGLDKAGAQPQLAQAPAVLAPPAVTVASATAPSSPQQGQQTVNVAGTQQVMIRDPRLDELMSAHRQFGGTSALQMPAGFLRNATFEGPAR